jgi:hypothetical protein
MMPEYGIAVLGLIVLLVAAVPYVVAIRHPRQKPFAAYLIFVSVFAVSAAVLAGLLAWLAGRFDLTAALRNTLPAVVFLLLIVLPALALATWQARKPPWRQQGPPD